MQGVPAGLELETIRKKISEHPGVAQVHDLHVWALGSQQPVLTAHVVLQDESVDPDHVRRSLAEALEGRFDIHHATLQVERQPCIEAHGHA